MGPPELGRNFRGDQHSGVVHDLTKMMKTQALLRS